LPCVSDDRGTLGGQIVPLGTIDVAVVDRDRRERRDRPEIAYRLPVLGRDAVEADPKVVEVRHDFRVAVRLLHQRLSLEVAGRSDPSKLEDRRRDVDLLHRTGDPFAAARPPGQPDEEGHMHDLLV